MKTINALNVNDALKQGLKLLGREGVEVPSRAGSTLEIPDPVCTIYSNPEQRVLIDSNRDANPFFHLMEAMWILAGRSDVGFLTEFNKRMAEYSDNGVHFNAPYGYRLREYFVDEEACDLDQLDTVVEILKNDPMSRQAVCQIWDTADLDKVTKDKACNMSLVFRVRKGALDLTVYNRSNDMLWGAYGANAVQFSMILEYVAAKVGIRMGRYYQVSNSYHVYLEGPGGDLYNKMINSAYPKNPYYEMAKGDLVLMYHEEMDLIDEDLKTLFNVYDSYGVYECSMLSCWKSSYFKRLIGPMLHIHQLYKREGAISALENIDIIKAVDWKSGAALWLSKRIK